MSELRDEIDAINAIYPESATKLGPGIVQITVPEHPELILRLVFPERYPMEKPSLIQVSARDAQKYPDVKYIESKISDLINSVFVEEMVIIFELVGEIQVFLESYELERARELQKMAEKMQQVKIENQREKLRKMAENEGKMGNINGAIESHIVATSIRDCSAGWTQSEPIEDRSSSFLAFAREVHSVEEAQAYIEELTSDRKISKATHNMRSVRIEGTNGTSFQDCDDDGETAAGLRMLHLMTIMNVWNVVVVVSRWFGGTQLGPDRFKHINAVTRAVLIKGGFFVEPETKKEKKKTKKKKK